MSKFFIRAVYIPPPFYSPMMKAQAQIANERVTYVEQIVRDVRGVVPHAPLEAVRTTSFPQFVKPMTRAAAEEILHRKDLRWGFGLISTTIIDETELAMDMAG